MDLGFPRIAFISYFYPNTMVGGASVYALNLCSALAEFVDTTVIVPKLNRRRVVQEKGINYKFCDSVNFPLFRSTSFYVMTQRQVKLDSFDIVHVNELASFLPKKIDVLTFHHRIKGLGPINYASYTLQKLCLRKARCIIAVSEKSRDELMDMGFRPKDVFIVHNGVDPKQFTPSLDSNRAKRILNIKEERVLLYVGSEGMSRRKNMPLLLKLMKYIKDVDLLLVVSQGKHKARFMSLAERFEVAMKVRYDCDVSSEMLPYYYSASDFLLYPSLQEGFGLVLLEAISSGKPYVSMDVGIASLLAERGFGYVANTEDGFLEKCMLMLKEPLQVGWRGNEFVRNNFSWRECARKTIEVYEKVMMTK